MRTKYAFAALVGVLCVLFAAPANAQVLNGSIVGQVVDTTSAAVPDAMVRITNSETNQSRVSQTNARGEYSFPTLPGGTYDMVVTKSGFQTFSVKGVDLSAGQVGRIDATLTVGAVSETISVTGEA